MEKLDKYRLKIDDAKNFFSLFDDAANVAKLNTCKLKDVVITPESNLWQITLVTDKDFDQQTLRAAEEFLRGKYRAEVEIRREVFSSDEIVAAEKNRPQRKG